MKHPTFLLCLLALCQMPGPAQELVTSSESVVTERGPHSRIWQRVSQFRTPEGRVFFRKSDYLELASGLHTWGDRQWLDSQEDVQMLANGFAVAQQGPHQVIFSPAISDTPAIDILTPAPENKRLQCRILGLVYRDALSGRDVLIAEPNPNSIAQLIPPNVILWQSAFDDVAADVQVRYSKGGIECEVILRRQPPPPSAWNMSAEHTRLEVWTEWFNPPEPRKQMTITRRTEDPALRQVMAEPDIVDEFLDFGHMQFIRGKAFRVGEEEADSIPVYKQWITLGQPARTFLIETVEYAGVAPMLEGLPLAAADRNAGEAQKRLAGRKSVSEFLAQANLSAPAKDVAQFESRKAEVLRSPEVQVAQRKAVIANAAGVSIDWTLVSSVPNFTFQNDRTHYISGPVNLSGSGSSPTNVTTFEGGTVIKFAPTNSAKLTVTSPIKWEGADYRPVVLTARDDHSVGESIGSASLSGYYADTALKIDADAAGTNAVLQNLRISHAKTAIEIVGRPDHVISHAQFVHCQNGIAPNRAIYHLRNALMYDVLTNFHAGVPGSSTGRCEHITIHQASTLNYTTATSTNRLRLTNSLLVAIMNSGAGYQTNQSSNVGATNSGATVFQTVGAAGHYLLNNTYRNIGTTNVNTSLLADIRKRTTYPPLLLTNSIQVDTVLEPQAQRDTDAPDYGFHYEPLDWAASGTVMGATLLLTNGVAVGTYGAGAAISKAFTSGKLASEGSATALNRLVRYNTVQEQATTNWSSSAGTAVNVTRGEVRFRFTDWSLLAGSGTHFYGAVVIGEPVHSFEHCQFAGGNFSTECRKATTILSNCFWDRVTIWLFDDYSTAMVRAYNNLFRGGALTLEQGGSEPWEFKDNLFHHTAIAQFNTTFSPNYNAYIANANRLTPHGVNDVILSNTPLYLTNTLGKYYYPTDDGMLSLLINAGSRNATNAGLYHFTVRGPDQAKETNTVVDIGFHYVATLNGVPIDTNSDGVPDYQADLNGSGTWEPGEIVWFPLPPFSVFITAPDPNAILP